MAQVKAIIGNEAYRTEIISGNNTIIADEPVDLGGKDVGFNPFELLAAALASCTAITLRMYAERKKLATGKITVAVSVNKNEQNNTIFNRKISTEHKTDEAITGRLLTIANACPTHKLLSAKIEITSIFENS